MPANDKRARGVELTGSRDAVPDRRPLVVAMTGASGAPYGVRFLERALGVGHAVDLVLSTNAEQVLRAELPHPLDLLLLASESAGRLAVHRASDLAARIASGSYPTLGMVVIPCSAGTLGRVAAGVSSSLIERAADVHLKERRPLVLVVREMPLNTLHLENMLRLSRAGAVIMPASPGFYGRPETIEDLLDFVVERVFQALGLPLEGALRWTGEGV
ncbi:MAG: flavin prenyltransferase UbiX [Planctomycetota bacterium]